MKKLLYLLLLSTLLISCSSDDETTPTTEPLKGDNITIDEIIGQYEIQSSIFDDGLERMWTDADNLQFIFNKDYSGIEFDPKTTEKKFFTWSYKNNIIEFKHSTRGNIKGWFKDSKLLYRYSSSDKKTIGTYSYKKIKQSIFPAN